MKSRASSTLTGGSISVISVISVKSRAILNTYGEGGSISIISVISVINFKITPTMEGLILMR